MKIRLNGEAREITLDATVHQMLIDLGLEPAQKGIAVAVDGEMVFRKDWQTIRLKPESKVEIVRAVAGG